MWLQVECNILVVVVVVTGFVTMSWSMDGSLGMFEGLEECWD